MMVGSMKADFYRHKNIKKRMKRVINYKWSRAQFLKRQPIVLHLKTLACVRALGLWWAFPWRGERG